MRIKDCYVGNTLKSGVKIIDMYQHEKGDPNTYYVVFQSYWNSPDTYTVTYIITDYVCRTCGEFHMVPKYRKNPRGFCSVRCARTWPSTVPWTPQRIKRKRIILDPTNAKTKVTKMKEKKDGHTAAGRLEAVA